MPIYEYECTDHGLFSGERPMARSAEPGECPVCCGAARRVLSATHTSCVPRATARARDRNEKSQHAPELRREPGKPRGQSRPRPALQASHGSRPWVLEHG